MFFITVVESVLLYDAQLWTLTRRLEIKPHECFAPCNTSWKQYQTKKSCIKMSQINGHPIEREGQDTLDSANEA